LQGRNGPHHWCLKESLCVSDLGKLKTVWIEKK
jgi:hypothetical protein